MNKKKGCVKLGGNQQKIRENHDQCRASTLLQKLGQTPKTCSGGQARYRLPGPGYHHQYYPINFFQQVIS